GSSLSLMGNRGDVLGALTRWVLGDNVYSDFVRGKLKCGFLCRLSPPPAEVWSIRVTIPIVQWRLFCRFAEPDTLIITGCRSRTLLGKRGSHQWSAAIGDCEAQWEKLFPGNAPFSGATIHDYVTENCDDFPI